MKSMKSTLGISALMVIVTTAALPASAAMMCTDAPIEKWMSRDQVAKMFTEKGYDVRKVKREDNCLEVYAIKDGKKMEIYIDPVNGKIVKTKIKG